MQGRRLLAGAAVLVGLAFTGCQQPASLRAAVGEVRPQDLVLSPPAPAAVRLQKAEGRDVTPTGRETNPKANSVNSAVSGGEVVAVIRATINGVPILDSEVREAALGARNSALRPVGMDRGQAEQKVLEAALDQIIDREVLFQEAMGKIKKIPKKDILEKIKEASDKEFNRWVRTVKSNFKTDEDFRQYLRSMGTSLENQKRMRERMFIAEEFLRSIIGPNVDRAGGHLEIMDYYWSHPEEFTREDSVAWQDIFLLASKYPTREAARQQAENLAYRARAGEDFVALCRQYDDGVGAGRQAAGQGSKPGQITPPEVEPLLFRMTDGQVGPVVELSQGFHVFKLVKREYAGRMPFDLKMETAIRDKLRNEAFLRERKRYLEELKKKVVI
jgi:parvulin-like peptidyl-prolyl isomerase